MEPTDTETMEPTLGFSDDWDVTPTYLDYYNPPASAVRISGVFLFLFTLIGYVALAILATKRRKRLKQEKLLKDHGAKGGSTEDADIEQSLSCGDIETGGDPPGDRADEGYTSSVILGGFVQSHASVMSSSDSSTGDPDESGGANEESPVVIMYTTEGQPISLHPRDGEIDFVGLSGFESSSEPDLRHSSRDLNQVRSSSDNGGVSEAWTKHSIQNQRRTPTKEESSNSKFLQAVAWYNENRKNRAAAEKKQDPEGQRISQSRQRARSRSLEHKRRNSDTKRNTVSIASSDRHHRLKKAPRRLSREDKQILEAGC